MPTAARLVTAGFLPLDAGQDTILVSTKLTRGSYIVFATAQLSMSIAPTSNFSLASFRLTLRRQSGTNPVAAESLGRPMLWQNRWASAWSPTPEPGIHAEVDDTLSLMVAGTLGGPGLVELVCSGVAEGAGFSASSATLIVASVDSVAVGPL